MSTLKRIRDNNMLVTPELRQKYNELYIKAQCPTFWSSIKLKNEVENLLSECRVAVLMTDSGFHPSTPRKLLL
jgi:hypothetical protein